ncbi:glycerate kinase [Formivibrio citricus]|nr:glycerate kinase [Formivibrio citricus]
MKIVIAPDSYKESLSAEEVADQIEAGFSEIFPDAEFVKLPMADGGEGTVSALVAATHGRIVRKTVTGPLGGPVEAFYGLTGDGCTAIIEMAAASGLELVPVDSRNPLRTTTYGTGELIRDALDSGVRHIIIGVGGSATNDGGVGMAQALGGRFLDQSGQQIAQGGGSLGLLDRIDMGQLDARLASCRIEVACDVTNPLTGPLGASAVFGPQKGATKEMIQLLDHGLARYSEIVKRDLGKDIAQVPGAGAGGGMGAATIAFLNAELRPGIEIVTQAAGLEAAVADADLVITGEGRIDSQTIHGKTPIGVARVAKRFSVPVIGIAGGLTSDVGVVHAHGIDAVFSVLYRFCVPHEALQEAAANVRMAARNIAAVLKMGQQLNGRPDIGKRERASHGVRNEQTVNL